MEKAKRANIHQVSKQNCPLKRLKIENPRKGFSPWPSSSTQGTFAKKKWIWFGPKKSIKGNCC